MKSTGIIRRIDDLSRVVIPKEIRRALRLREGDPLEIYMDDERGGVLLRKYSPIATIAAELCQTYADSLFEMYGYPVLVTDTDTVIAVAGPSAAKQEFLNTQFAWIRELTKPEAVHLIYYESYVFSQIISEDGTLGLVLMRVNHDSDVAYTSNDLTHINSCQLVAKIIGKQLKG